MDTVKYKKNNKLHRIDGPAIIWCDKSEEWWKNGKLHCITGPAKVYKKYHNLGYSDMENYYIKEWWINGKRCSESDHSDYVKFFIKKWFDRWKKIVLA